MGPYTGVRGEGPEYETLAGFGAQLLNDDLTAIAALNDLCARYGLDTISLIVGDHIRLRSVRARADRAGGYGRRRIGVG